MAVDKFGINPFLRFMLAFRALAPLAFIGIIIWALSSPYLGLSKWGPLILLGLVGWAVWEIIQLCRWFGFSLEISDHSIVVSGTELKWNDIESAQAKAAVQFDTFIELRSKDDRVLKIPACVQQNSFVLAKIEKHFPSIDKKQIGE